MLGLISLIQLLLYTDGHADHTAIALDLQYSMTASRVTRGRDLELIPLEITELAAKTPVTETASSCKSDRLSDFLLSSLPFSALPLL